MVAISSLALGLVIGYLGQRSRLCFIAGYRDFIMARDATLLRGVLAAFIGALAGYAVFHWFGGNVPAFPSFVSTPGLATKSVWLWTIVGGLGVGVVGVMSGGCPFRMHVLACEGKRTYWAYLAGFYGGIVFFNLITAPAMQAVTRYLK